MDLFNLITPNTTLLTPNRRLAATLLNQYNQLYIQQQKTCWKTLDILPLPSWLQRLWNEFSATEIKGMPYLLSANQKSILWQMILNTSAQSDGLLQINETAKLAESAYELLKLWEVNFKDPILSSTEDGYVFQEWAKQFKKICQKNNWMDNTDLADIIKENLIERKIIAPEKIILVGFTEISPLHISLFNLLKKFGTQITHYNTQRLAKSVKKINLPDEETEIRTMARWAKRTYESIQEKRPYLIGCVVPRLETLRESVLQIFSDIFTEQDTFTLDHTLLPFNVSAGKNLLSFPIIKTALELLKLAQQTISLETFNHLLRSPFLGDAESEQLKRSSFENRLKNANVTSLKIKKLISTNSSYHFSSACPALAKRMQHYLTYFSSLKKTLTLSEWAKHFIELLKLLGWPGERSLNSQEYQITQRWLNLLLEFSNLDSILEPQHFSQAIEHLSQLTAKTIFQPQSPEAPIQILGVLEAAELPFEHLWVMSLDDSNWPATPKPNPLIPQRLQKTLNMPHATTERELLYSETLIKQLKTSASENVIFSYPENNEDIPLRPSSLLHSVESITIDELALSDFSSSAKTIFATQQLETFTDETAPPIEDNENIRGGTHIFKQQAACPFKAFAELRLHARFIDPPILGLRPIDRGNIMHKALELIWQSIKNSTTLKSLSENELKDIVHRSAAQAIKHVLKPLDNEEANTRYLLLELQRLEKILLDWLLLESQRPDFEVAFQEHEIQTQIGNIPITLRVDRIDQLADGSQLIIDYKTGKNNEIKYWFGERLDEPQLPLYCLLSGDTISGISFGQLHPDDMTLKGISKKNIDIKSIKTLPEIKHATSTSWDQQLQEWKTVLENLSNDFLRGVAHVDPKDSNQICNHCHLHTFCRVHEK